jgi:hypothetical protein
MRAIVPEPLDGIPVVDVVSWRDSGTAPDPESGLGRGQRASALLCVILCNSGDRSAIEISPMACNARVAKGASGLSSVSGRAGRSRSPGLKCKLLNLANAREGDSSS